MKIKVNNFNNLLVVLAAVLISFSSVGQMQVGNSDFESFDELGNSKERPGNWNNMKNGSLCPLCGFGSKQTTWRDTLTRPGSAGTYSVKIKSDKAGSTIINGNLTLGELNAPNTTPANGYNKSKRSESQFSELMTDKPDSIIFWAKYSVTTTNDSARVSAIIHGDFDYRDPQDTGSEQHVVAKAVRNFQTSGNWIRMSVPFDYSGPATDAQYILVSLISSHKPGNGVNGATLWVDDLELIYNQNELDISPIADQNLFVNSSGTMLTANETPNAASSVTSRQWKSATTLGGPYTTISGETNSTYTPTFAAVGTYYVVCETNFDGDVITSNEVKVNVVDYSVHIAPLGVQTLVTNQPGSQLIAAENGSPTSRQWKVATSLGGTYSDLSGEIGDTYIPQFANPGTYYVICETTFSGSVKRSNEAIIIVEDFTNSIEPATLQNLVENQTGSTLTVIENYGGGTRKWKSATTSGGTYTDISGQINTTYTPLFSSAGTYFVVCESTVFGNTYISNEVEIIVSVPTVNVASISPTSIQTLIENQIGNSLSVSEIPAAADSREWKFTSTSGSGYTSFATTETGTTYTPLFGTEGTYYVVCVSDFGNGDIVISNEVQINVEEFFNAVNPGADQTLIETTSGTLLTVTETPIADSREWKFSTTAGSGYTSFTIAETGMTYTPEFATAGTYYVVCESTIENITTLSNEVFIVVDPLAGLSKNAMLMFSVFATDQILNVDFSKVDMDDASIKVMSSEGRTVAHHKLKNKQMNSIQIAVPTGIYFFSINNGKEVYQGKVYIQ